MFAAYSQDKDDGKKPDSDYQPLATDERSQTRCAVQRATIIEHTKRKKKRLAQQEDDVIQQVGYGESDSDDDMGGVRIMLDVEHHKTFEQVHMAPEKRKQMELKAIREQTVRKENPYGSFPSSSTPINPYAPSQPSTSKRDDGYSDKKRRRDRSRDRDSDRRRDRKDKKKKHRRRSSSSSSSSRSRDRRDRRRDRWETRRSPSPKKQKIPSVRYSFLTENEYNERNSFQNHIFVVHKIYDSENYVLGQNKKEVSKCRLEVRFIDGKSYDEATFNSIYGAECKEKKQDRPFHEELAAIAKIKPSETIFKRIPINEGFWRLAQSKDVRNVYTENDEEHEDDAFREEFKRTKQAVRDNDHDVAAVIKLVDMEEEMYQLNTGSFVQVDRKAHLERRESILQKCMDNNRKNVQVRMKYIECLIELGKDGAAIVAKYKDYSRRYCHDPIVWIRYMDHVQFNSTVYTFDEMNETFRSAHKRIAGLAEGTNLSHAHLITDRPEFYAFQLYAYIRLLKWQFACGHVPLAIANIQATFELNFGMDDESRLSNDERMKVFEKFWNLAMPRIGDRSGVGIKMSEKIAVESAEEVYNMERVEHEELFAATLNTVMTKLRSVETSNEAKWVEFEREMLEIDARPKRTSENNQVTYADYADDFSGINIWETITMDDLTIYYNADPRGTDCVQPLLELMGVSFLHTSGCYSPTEQVIESWKCEEDLLLDNNCHFDTIPTYSENTTIKIGKRILKFMITQRYQISRYNHETLDELLIKYILALTVTETLEMEKNMKFHHLKWKKIESMFNSDIKNVLQTIFDASPKLLPLVCIIAGERFVSWWERGCRDQEDIQLRSKAAHSIGVVVTDSDKKNLKTCQKQIFAFLSCVPRANRLKDMACNDLQVALYTEILRTRLASTDEKGLRMWLASLLLDDVTPEDLPALSLLPEFTERVRDGVKSLVETVKRREQTEFTVPVPEFPRPEALAEAMYIIVEFAFLNQIPNKRLIVTEAVENVLRKCDLYEQRLKDFQILPSEKEKDKWDTQFVLDTILRLLFPSKMQIAYNELYKKVVSRAAELFPCHVRYMRKFTDAHSGSTLKNMQLKRIVAERNKKIMEKRLERFDVELERKQLMYSLATMFSSMRLASDRSNARALFEVYKTEALNLHDPAVWRLALKAASRAVEQCGRDVYDNDAIIRAIGQCPWSLNIHLDHVEEVKDVPVKGNGNMTQLTSKLMYLLDNGGSMKHITFIDDEDTLNAHHDIAVELAKVAEAGDR